MPRNEGANQNRLAAILQVSEPTILHAWTAQQATDRGIGRVTEDLGPLSRRFLHALVEAVAADPLGGAMNGSAWEEPRSILADFARARSREGFSPSETATFVFSLKRPTFEALRQSLGGDAGALADDIWTITVILDQLGLYTTEVLLKERQQIIARQRDEMLELSTPVVELWDSILALPLIGTLDSARTGIVMENLLQRIVDTGAEIAIIDITGVATVDTLVAQHLLKTVAAARLMGADCIISGIRPQIAQTLVHLGVALNEVTTKATLAAAFTTALERTGQSVSRADRP